MDNQEITCKYKSPTRTFSLAIQHGDYLSHYSRENQITTTQVIKAWECHDFESLVIQDWSSLFFFLNHVIGHITAIKWVLIFTEPVDSGLKSFSNEYVVHWQIFQTHFYSSVLKLLYEVGVEVGKHSDSVKGGFNLSTLLFVWSDQRPMWHLQPTPCPSPLLLVLFSPRCQLICDRKAGSSRCRRWGLNWFGGQCSPSKQGQRELAVPPAQGEWGLWLISMDIWAVSYVISLKLWCTFSPWLPQPCPGTK